jgi:hypothetical protein
MEEHDIIADESHGLIVQNKICAIMLGEHERALCFCLHFTENRVVVFVGLSTHLDFSSKRVW